MTTTPIILRDDDYWSETEQVHVENRGAAFGKITVWNDDVAVAQFTWAANGTIRPIGLGEPSRAYKERAIRALAETPWGAKALGTDQRTPEFIAASRRHHIGNPHNIDPAGESVPDGEMSDDEMANCMIVTGAVWGALSASPTCTSATPERNTVTVGLDFMKSKYLITVTRIEDDF
jgi:hypothetical protein